MHLLVPNIPTNAYKIKVSDDGIKLGANVGIPRWFHFLASW